MLDPWTPSSRQYAPTEPPHLLYPGDMALHLAAAGFRSAGDQQLDDPPRSTSAAAWLRDALSVSW